MIDRLRPVALLFPDRSRRWVNRACREGRIPGAIKLGREWLISESAAARLVGGEAPRAKTLDVVELLQRKGLAA